MRLRRFGLAAALAGAVALLAACAAPAPTAAPAAPTAAAGSTSAPEVKVTMSDCEEPPLGSRVSRKCPHGQMKASQGTAAPAETTTK